MSDFTLTGLELKDPGVGGGLAVVMQTPSGKTYLYDTGFGYPDGDGWIGDYNSGRDSIMPYLEARGVTTLDGVISSHAHYDHFGGLLWLVDHIRIDRLYDAGYRFPGDLTPAWARECGDYERLRSRFKQQGRYVAAHAGDRLDLDDQLEVDVLAPPRAYFGDPCPELRLDFDTPAHYLLNANSIVVRIRHGDLVFLLPGDIQHEDQVQSLIPNVDADALRCDVLVAPAHGIHAAPEFAAATQPEITIVPVTLERYRKGIPAPEVYSKVGSKVLATGLNGDVSVRSDGHTYTVDAERPDAT